MGFVSSESQDAEVHEAPADFDRLLGALYLLAEGAGAWSLDAVLARRAGPPQPKKD